MTADKTLSKSHENQHYDQKAADEYNISTNMFIMFDITIIIIRSSSSSSSSSSSRILITRSIYAIVLRDDSRGYDGRRKYIYIYIYIYTHICIYIYI